MKTLRPKCSTTREFGIKNKGYSEQEHPACFSLSTDEIDEIRSVTYVVGYLNKNLTGRALEYNMKGKCPFFKNLHNLFTKKICISIPCFGITDYNNLQKTIGKTIAYYF